MAKLQLIPPSYKEYLIDVSSCPDLPMNFNPELEMIYDFRANPKMLGPNVENPLEGNEIPGGQTCTREC